MCETLQFLDCICGSTTGGLGLLGLYINEKNVALINQTLESLTEYCQGPCHENQVLKLCATDTTRTLPSQASWSLLPFPRQNCIATHESNGIDIIIALILNDINPLGKKRMDLVLELKVSCLCAASGEEKGSCRSYVDKMNGSRQSVPNVRRFHSLLVSCIEQRVQAVTRHHGEPP